MLVNYLKYEFILFNSIGFVFFKTSKGKRIKIFFKLSKKIINKSIVRHLYKKKLNKNIFILKYDYMLLFIFYNYIYYNNYNFL